MGINWTHNFFDGQGGIRSTKFSESIRNDLSPVESLEPDSTRVTRVVYVDWEKRFRAARDLLGYPKITYANSLASTKYISRILPHAYEEFPVLTVDDEEEFAPNWLYCRKVSTKPVGLNREDPDSLDADTINEDTDTASYNQAQLTLTYESLTFEILSDSEMRSNGFVTSPGSSIPDESLWARYVTVQPNPQADYLSLPRGFLKYAEGPAKGTFVPEALGKIVATWDLAVTWHEVPRDNVPFQTITDTLGTVNSDVIGDKYAPNFPGFIAGSLLLLAPQYRNWRSPLGQRLVDITYFFKYFKQTHKRFPYFIVNPSPPPDNIFGFAEVTVDGTSYTDAPTNDGKHVFDARPFRALFLPA